MLERKLGDMLVRDNIISDSQLEIALEQQEERGGSLGRIIIESGYASEYDLAAALGRQLEVLGIDIAFSTTAVVLAQAFVALPFLVLSVEGAARTAGRRHEVVAATLGARPTTVLRRVTIPLLMPALGSGTALAFARCLGEFGATLTFAGSLQGVTRTLPLEIYLQRETDPDAAIALSLILILIAAVRAFDYRLA